MGVYLLALHMLSSCRIQYKAVVFKCRPRLVRLTVFWLLIIQLGKVDTKVVVKSLPHREDGGKI